jgi:hypothetical protein
MLMMKALQPVGEYTLCVSGVLLSAFIAFVKHEFVKDDIGFVDSFFFSLSFAER